MHDLVYNQMFDKITSDPNIEPRYSIRWGFLMLNGKLVIPSDSSIKCGLFDEAHNTLVGEHSGCNATLARFFASFF